MRILHISSAKTFGGGEKHLVDLCRGLTLQGNDVFVAIRPTCEWRERLSFLPTENILTVSIRNSFGLLSSKKIASFVRANAIQVIHAHLGRDYITASIVTRLSSEVRCVLTRHVLFPLKSFNRFVLSNVDRVIAVTEDVRRSLSGVFETRKVRVIYNGSPSVPKTPDERKSARRTVRERLGMADDQLVIGVVGSISEIKGQDLAVEALGKVSDSRSLRLVVVGRPEPREPFATRLDSAIASSSQRDDILCLDRDENIEELICGFDVLLSPSRSESFGLVILEAMLAGIPVVATPTRGASFLLNRGECGFIADSFEPSSIAESIDNCLRHEPQREIKVGNAVRRATDLFSLKRMIEKTESLYRELVS